MTCNWTIINANEILETAAKKGDLDTIKDVCEEHEVSSLSINKAFNNACFNGHLEVAKFLDKNMGAEINYGEGFAFRSACRRGHLEIVKYLLTHNKCKLIDIHRMDNLAFISACQNNHMDIVLLLLENTRFQKENPNRTEMYKQALIEVVKTPHRDMLSFILNNPYFEQDFNIHNISECRSIYINKGEMRHVEYFTHLHNKLLKYPVLNKSQQQGFIKHIVEVCLYRACCENKFEEVKYILNNYPEASIYSSENRCIEASFAPNNTSVAEYLIYEVDITVPQNIRKNLYVIRDDMPHYNTIIEIMERRDLNKKLNEELAENIDKPKVKKLKV